MPIKGPCGRPLAALPPFFETRRARMAILRHAPALQPLSCLLPAALLLISLLSCLPLSLNRR